MSAIIETPRDPKLLRLTAATRMYYDMQRQRIATSHRARPRAKDDGSPPPILLPEDVAFFNSQTAGLLKLEKDAARHIQECIEGIPIYDRWCKPTRGIGPIISAVMIAGFDIRRSDKISSYWQYSGLGMQNNHIQKRVRGEKASYNPEMKTRLLGVLPDLIYKSTSLDDNGNYFFYTGSTCAKRMVPKQEWCPACKAKLEAIDREAEIKAARKLLTKAKRAKKRGEDIDEVEVAMLKESILEPDDDVGDCIHRRRQILDPRVEPVWRKVADDRKHRRLNQVGPCMRCAIREESRLRARDGADKAKLAFLDEDPDDCPNCEGTGRGPWGTSPDHRKKDANRYMAKMLVKEFVRAWKELEGLPLRLSYEEEYLGHVTSVAMPRPSAFFV